MTSMFFSGRRNWLIAFYIHTLGIEDIGNSRGGVMNNVAWKFQGGVVLCHISRVQCKR
jgi:hypothetical protein